MTRKDFSTMLLLLFLFLAPLIKSETLTVHIIAHSHCDPGWLDTFEQYYRRDVSRILTGVTNALSTDRSKRFIWSEISFFMRWWDSQNESMKNKFKILVANGQMEFVGGGWVQNDEANPTAEAVMNQVSQGHDYIHSIFGVRPHIGWQIDPFGHSALTPSLWSLMGYDAMVINRIHYLTKKQYKSTKSMEFVWQGSRLSNHNELDTSMFTHVLHSHYSAPRGYDWEEPGVPRVSQWNAASRGSSLAAKMKGRANAYRTKHLLVTFGDDFKFKNANLQFQNMDLIIKAINNNPGLGVSIRYSTLSEYFSAVHSESQQKNIAFPFHRGDFFPYADNGDSYWTGYYSTRPTLKRACRLADATLRAAEALFAFGRGRLADVDSTYDWSSSFNKIRRLRNEAALVLHHDAITGTSRTTVVRDYQQRLTQGSNEIQSVSVDMLQVLLASSKTRKITIQHSTSFTAAAYALDISQLKNEKSSYPIVIQNPLGWERHDVVSVKVLDGNLPFNHLQVVDGQGNPIRAQIHATMDPTNVHTSSPTSNVRLFIEVRIPAMGIMTYYVRTASKKDRLEKKNLVECVTTELVEVDRSSGRVTMPTGAANGGLRGGTTGDTSTFSRRSDWFPTASKEDMSVFNDPANPGNIKDGTGQLHLKTRFLSVRLQKYSGSIDSVHRKKDEKQNAMTRKVSQEWMRYTSSRSGAYLFRPHGTASKSRGESERVTIAVSCGSLVQQVRYFASHVEQVTTLYDIKGPMGDVVHVTPSSTADMNEEVVLRFNTDIVTSGTFYTDNGADLMKRHRDSSKPTPANFYPMNAGMALRESNPRASSSDKTTKTVMVLNDHPMACASLTSDSSGASMEMMVARSLREDDGRGLAQGVHDSSRSRAPTYILLDESVRSQGKYRRYSQYLHHPLRTYLAAPSGGKNDGAAPINTNAWRNQHVDSFAPMSSLPNGLHLLTFKAHDVSAPTDFYVRLQSFANVLLQPTATLFNAYDVSNVQETTLSFVEEIGLSKSKQLHYKTEQRTEQESELPKTIAEQNDGDDDDGNQNTEEEGVFISAAALAKLEEDKKGRRRALLDTNSGKVFTFQIPPFQIKSYKMNVIYNPSSPAAEGATPVVVAASEAKASAVVATKDVPVVVTEAQKAAVADAVNHQVGGVARGTGKTATAPIQPVPTVPPPIQTGQPPVVRRGTANAANTANTAHTVLTTDQIAEAAIPKSSTIDGTHVPHRVKHAVYGLTRQSGKSVLGIELGFLGGVIFGLSMAVLCFLCWQMGGNASKTSGSTSKNGNSARVSSQRTPNSGKLY